MRAKKEGGAGKAPGEKAVSLGLPLIDSYDFEVDTIPISVAIYKKGGEFVPVYEISISSISKNTELVLEKVRQELVTEVNLGMVDILGAKKQGQIEKSFRDAIKILVKKHFPDANDEAINFLSAYLIQKSLGLGNVEILMGDGMLEEIAINNAADPVWVYHRKHGWLKTNVLLQSEDQVRNYSAMIGRRIGRQITTLEPLMDANMSSGDRVNATLFPISLKGNTITLRKFASRPWTITDFLEAKSISYEAAALIWLAVQYELSTLIAGGTASGKTSFLNVVSNFFPPNQRLISIEDTHELQLPKFLHWVPFVVRLPNVEGRGGVSMLNLLVNSLRMRPDRIIVGEIRRKKEAEVLFEAIHTGHSVYATIHANSVRETITRLTSPPLNIPVSMISALSLIIVQYRNRRSGLRRTFQVAEVLEDGTPHVLLQFDIKKDVLVKTGTSKSLIDTLRLYTGMTNAEIQKNLEEKETILKWLVAQKIKDVDEVGLVMAEYYTNSGSLMKRVRMGKPKERK